jgi:hypothetical protein
VFVYLEGSPTKGVVANHYVTVCPGEHLGLGKVIAAWVETNSEGKLVGRVFPIHFVNGKADTEDDALGEYLIEFGHALREPWRPPAGIQIGGEDSAWRWRA